MQKIAGAGATAQNTFTKGDPATGVPATEVTQEWLNTMQAELVYIVEQAGLTLDSLDNTQVKVAIDMMIAAQGAAVRQQSTLAQAIAGTNTTTDMSPAAVKQAIVALGSKGLGEGQTWQNMTASRTAGVTYTNTTGRSIFVTITETTDVVATLYVDGIRVSYKYGAVNNSNLSAIVPNGSTYRFTGGLYSNGWAELR